VKLDRCLISKTNMGWLRHQRLAHVRMRNFHKLQKDDNILRLTNIVLRKIGIAKLAKLESKLEPIIMSRIL
jgi:hypothetical protein